MRSVYISLIAATVGAFIGASTTYYLTGNNPSAEGSPASVNHAQIPPHNQKIDIPVTSVSTNATQNSTTGGRGTQPLQTTDTAPSSTSPDAVKKKPDPAEEEGTVQIVLSRLYDPTMTLPGLMQSEEMLKLSEESRERVVAKMVEMLNRGEIDARVFMPAGK